MAFLREKNGRWSPEKIAAFAVAIAPAIWLAVRLAYGDLGPRPVTEAIHFSGRWAVRLLLLSLAITPLRQLIPVGKPLLARRTLGVAASCYAVLHLTLYIVDQKYNLATVATEIVLRVYLTIGFVALIGLVALGVTSTDAWIRRLGPRWNTLHAATYPVAVLAILHFMMQKKLDIYEPTLMAGFVIWLLGYRLWRRSAGQVGFVRLLLLAIVSAVLTATLEALWYGVKTGVNPLLILQANLMFEVETRPAWYVLIAAAAVAVCHAVSAWWRPQPRMRTAARGTAAPAP